jgi:hypothetical protein
MSLSMRDRQVLAEIERDLTEHDPRLARLFAALGAVGGSGVRRSGSRRRSMALWTSAGVLLFAGLALVAGAAVLKMPDLMSLGIAAGSLAPLVAVWPATGSATRRDDRAAGRGAAGALPGGTGRADGRNDPGDTPPDSDDDGPRGALGL